MIVAVKRAAIAALVTLIYAGAATAEIRDYEFQLVDGQVKKGEVHDAVVVALPFTVLRAAVSLHDNLGLSAGKRLAIDELGYGTNTKVLQPFLTRFWREQGESGEGGRDRRRARRHGVPRSLPGTHAGARRPACVLGPRPGRAAPA